MMSLSHEEEEKSSAASVPSSSIIINTISSPSHHTTSTLIPHIPPRSNGFSLDSALSSLDIELTGIQPGRSSLHSTQLHAGKFEATNFYIEWREKEDGAGGSNTRAHTANASTKPSATQQSLQQQQLLQQQQQLLLDGSSTTRPRTSHDFPRELKFHRQNGSASARDHPSSSHSQRRPLHSRTGRDVASELTELERSQTLIGVKPKTAGEQNKHIGPGSYTPAITVASLKRGTTSYKPSPPKPLAASFLQTPAPGSYNNTLPDRIPSMHFGGTQKTRARGGAGATGNGSSSTANQTGAIGTDSGGPGTYDKFHEPIFGGEPSSTFLRAPRFANTPGTSTGGGFHAPVHLPGPGQYNIHSSVSSSSSSAIGSGKDSVSFAGRSGVGSAAASAVAYKRSSGPAVGTYNPYDASDIGGACNGGMNATTGGGQLMSVTAKQHRFSSTPRFIYQSKPHPLYALVISSAKQRSLELQQVFKPDLSEFKEERKKEKLEEQRIEREVKSKKTEENRTLLRAKHQDMCQRILHAEEYRQIQRDQEIHTQLQQYIKKGWLFYIALAARTEMIQTNIRRIRTAKNLRLLTRNAARTIVAYARKWARKAREKKEVRCGYIILRAVRRNVIRASLKRKKRAVSLLSILLCNQYNKQHTLQCIRKYRQACIILQRCIRAYFHRKHASLQLLHKQWLYYENLLSTRYKSEEGMKAFEKIRKKGLLIKNIAVETQKQRIIRDIPFDFITERLRNMMVEQDYLLRLKTFIYEKYKWRSEKHAAVIEENGGIVPPEFMSIVDQARERRKKQLEAKLMEQQQAEEKVNNPNAAVSAGSSAAVNAVSGKLLSAANAGSSPAAVSPSSHSIHASDTESAPTPSFVMALTPSSSVYDRSLMRASPTAVALASLSTIAQQAYTSGLPAGLSYSQATQEQKENEKNVVYFLRLITPLRVYWLITQAQSRQVSLANDGLTTSNGNISTGLTMDVELKKKYKILIGSILRQKEMKRLKEKEKADAAAAAAAVALAIANGTPLPATATTAATQTTTSSGSTSRPYTSPSRQRTPATPAAATTSQVNSPRKRGGGV